MIVAAGLLAAYWWYYKLAPGRHLTSPTWLASHSELARWQEEQKDYRRMGSSPDVCFRGDSIGFYGGKEWFLWLESKIRNSDRFRHCGCTEYALSLMANRQAASWSQWTDANHHRSQEEWIQDGFRDYGVTVHLPPTPDDSLPLLRLLGRTGWNTLWRGTRGTNAPGTVPTYVHYNAYRWLRDSGFEPGKFASSNATVVLDPVITAGLLKYSQWCATYPGRDGLGVLAFGGARWPDWDIVSRGIISKPWVALCAEILIPSCIIGGALLVWSPVVSILSRAGIGFRARKMERGF